MNLFYELIIFIMNFNNPLSNKVCTIIPKEGVPSKSVLQLREVLEFYEKMRKQNIILSGKKDFYNELVSKGEYFKEEIKKNLSTIEYNQFVSYLNEIKNLEYLF